MPGAYVVLFIAIFFLSMAGILIRLAEANAYAIVFYRMFLAFWIILPINSYVRKQRLLPPIKELSQIALMGFLFSLHIITWVLAIQSTKVANAATCLAIQPVCISLGAHFFFGEKMHLKTYLALIAGTIGVILIGYGDFSLSGEFLKGDLLAVLSAVLYALYFFAGKHIRSSATDNFVMMMWVYIFAALTVLLLFPIVHFPLWDFKMQSWIFFIALAIFPTILGHASVFLVIKQIPSSIIGILMLLEPVLAGIVAYYLFGEQITVLTLLGYIIIIVGMLPLFYKKESA